jgi:Cu(I)/Ag(I) efflux system membrane fusion protein
MFVRSVVSARVAAGERVVATNLAGKWISPMHPEIIRDAPGSCDVCGMDLVRASELGYASAEDVEPPLVVPASAVLRTGRRAVVYVRVRDEQKPTFEGVEVQLGPRAGDHFVVRSGLEEGQEVVTNGSFKIDSALQLMARPSMMSDPGSSDLPADETARAAEEEEQFPVSDAVRKHMDALVSAYLALQKALAADDFRGAREAVAGFQEVIARGPARGEGHEAWARLVERMSAPATALVGAASIQKQRESFAPLSSAMEGAVRRIGALPSRAVRKFVCPMAFDNKGAVWLQVDETVSNPYFGSTMLRCGEQVEVISEPRPDDRN